MKRLLALIVFSIAQQALCSVDTVGPDGINSLATGLTGAGIQIGQIESLRSSVRYDAVFGFPYDDAASSATNTNPFAVYFQTTGGQDPPNTHNDFHPTVVAGVMIGTTASCGQCLGVSPEAHLYSIGYGGANDDYVWALTLNRLLTLSGVTIRATNTSIGLDLDPFTERPIGWSHITKFYDWSSRRYNVLHVIAWGNEEDFPRKPQDQYNGIIVASSARPPGETKYREYASHNAFTGYPYSANAFGGEDEERPGIDLLAPGDHVRVLGWNDEQSDENGTSVAAPHVTGAIALLQQYAKPKVEMGVPGWTTSAQRHEVMKSVLLTAADKLNGVQGSNRDILDKDGKTYGGVDRRNPISQPLNRYIGAGHLNVKRALDLFKTGEQNPGIVSKFGWDYNTIGSAGSEVEYVFDSPGGGYIAATLAWDRRVELTDPDNTYSFGDDFFNRPWYQELNNLDLFLVAKNETVIDPAHSEWMSLSNSGNVEHLFFNMGDGEWKLVVKNQASGAIGDAQNYGISWWFGSAPPGSNPGDYDNDGDADGGDEVLWRKDPGSFGGSPGGYDTWRANYGNVYSGSGSGSSLASVPKPSAIFFAFIGMLICVANRRRVFRRPD